MAYYLKKRRPRSLSAVESSGTSTARSDIGSGVYTRNAGAAVRTRRQVPPHSAQGGSMYSGTSAAAPENTRDAGTAAQRRASRNTAAAYSADENAPSGRSETGENSYGGFEDAYNRIIDVLGSYGIAVEIPTYDELYAQLEALLRPSVDAAIARRRSYGESMMAELDADAYSRGMGGSSYLSGMKNREYDSIASDIAGLEAGYTSDIANHIYNAAYELNRLQAQFAAILLQNELDRQAEQEKAAASSGDSGSSSGHGSGRGSGSSGRGSGSSSGSDNGGESKSSSYDDYTAYIEYLSDDDRYRLFHSSSEYWADIRSRMIDALSAEDYRRLRDIYDTGGSGNGGSGGGGSHAGGDDIWQSILY